MDVTDMDVTDMDVTDMAELPGAGGRKVCSLFVLEESSRIRPPETCFFAMGPPGKIFTASGVWMSGKTICRKADGFGEPKRPNAAGATIRR
jgi:hypothetical protein